MKYLKYVFSAILILGLAILLFSPMNDLEKAVPVEARAILYNILKAQKNYKFQHGSYANSLTELFKDWPAEDISNECKPNCYFRYQVNNIEAIATRCTKGGKYPARKAYILKLNYESGKITE
jgi:hypothetical protein